MFYTIHTIYCLGKIKNEGIQITNVLLKRLRHLYSKGQKAAFIFNIYTICSKKFLYFAVVYIRIKLNVFGTVLVDIQTETRNTIKHLHYETRNLLSNSAARSNPPSISGTSPGTYAQS